MKVIAEPGGLSDLHGVPCRRWDGTWEGVPLVLFVLKVGVSEAESAEVLQSQPLPDVVTLILRRDELHRLILWHGYVEHLDPRCFTHGDLALRDRLAAIEERLPPPPI